METSKHGHPQTFFLGRAKIFQGARTYFMPLKQQKDTIFSLKIYYFTGGARAPLHPPPDTYASKYYLSREKCPSNQRITENLLERLQVEFVVNVREKKKDERE